MMFLLASVLLIVLPVNAIDIHRIVGGRNVSIEDYPYMVSVIYRNNAFCGGSIISTNIVLTAAHCLHSKKRKNKKLYKIKVGETISIPRPAKQEHKVARLWIHAKHHKPTVHENDIGIIKIKGSFEYGPKVQPIPLIREEVPCGEMVIISGWGRMQQRFAKIKIRHLQAAAVPIVCMQDCKKAYRKARIRASINNKKLCDGYSYGGVDTCQGDSGGPLMYQGKQIGIVSFGLGCADGKYPGVNMKVSAYIKWIEQFID